MFCLLVFVLVGVWQGGSAQETTRDYVISLNGTDNATVYCFSDYLSTLKLETEECLRCRMEVKQNSSCARGSGQSRPIECKCKDECSERERHCPFTAAEHSTCLTKVKSRDPVKRLVCTGFIAEGGNLTINIQIVMRRSGSELCYGRKSGTPLNKSDLVETGAMYLDSKNESIWKEEHWKEIQKVTFRSQVLCINSSNVDTLNAGHLLGVGYTLQSNRPVTGHDADEEHAEDQPEFQEFCRVDRPKLWKRKEGFMLGTVYQCNGSYHVLQDEFPCLQFPPTGRGLKLPSLENCSTGQMVGIVVIMILAMVLCYTVLIACVKLWSYFCKCAKKETFEIPLAHADSSTNSRTTLAGSVSVVKQESRDSILSGVAMQPAPPPPPQQQPTLNEGNEQLPLTPA